jgi:probable F420-dependent oxidoreductase
MRRPLHVGVQLQGQHTSWAEYTAAAALVEELGFDSLWTFDHLLPISGSESGSCFETITTLSALATLTHEIRLGVLVNGVLYREPITLAKSAAQIDHISAGRLEFSLGAGWAAREFRTYGLHFPPPSERRARLDEALQVVRLLWTMPRASFNGAYYRLEDAPCEPKPLQQPHPPITIGGSAPGLLRLVARHANRWSVLGTPRYCAERAAALRSCCDEIGRDLNEIELSVHAPIALAASGEKAESLADQLARELGCHLASERAGWLIGTPDDVARQMGRYLELGISHFVVSMRAPFDATLLRLLRHEVIPILANDR